MITTSDGVVSYLNGNCVVSLFADGTKIREWPESEAAHVEYPESIDLKITDYCDAGCAWCHERSTVRGRHASGEAVRAIIAGMLPGSELAIGGGNPLDHPEIEGIVLVAREHGCVPNLTVNARHLISHQDALEKVRPYLGGLGISYADRSSESEITEIANRHTVVHLIVGVDSPDTVFRLASKGICKFLILGYKRYGRGARYTMPEKGPTRVARWRYFLPSMLRDSRLVVSFDNLGLEQLGVREMIGEEMWNRHYMGDDGQFTMYVDAVREEFAVSSTSERKAVAGRTIREMFAEIRKESTC